MCRSIKTLRPPFVEEAGEDDVRAAALQYVRKISGFRAPATHNAAAFTAAVDAVTAATQELLDRLEVRGGGTRTSRSLDVSGHAGSRSTLDDVRWALADHDDVPG